MAPNVGSDRSWVYNVVADYADNVPKPELLAIRFANSENAQIFKEKFEEGQKINSSLLKGSTKTKNDAEPLSTSPKKEESKESKESNSDSIKPSATSPKAETKPTEGDKKDQK